MFNKIIFYNTKGYFYIKTRIIETKGKTPEQIEKEVHY
jgi:hypothetical protein